MSASKVALPSLVGFFSLAAVIFCYFTGTINLHYDGVAHLNIARRVFDHPFPHYSHLGTVWLPLQHLLLLPWVQNDFLWREGFAGTVVSVGSFWLACYYLFQLSFLAYGCKPAGFLSVAAFVFNPNILYLQVTPLGEMLYVALFLAVLFYLLRITQQSKRSVLPCAIAVLLASLTRYDGWLLVPLGACVVLLTDTNRQRNWRVSLSRLMLYLLVASSGILGWLLYNLAAFNDPLAFARGEYATQNNIIRIISEAGLSQYPPFHNLFSACQYYGQAVLLSAGAPLVILGSLGFAWFVSRHLRTSGLWILAFCFLFPPLFYVANMVRGTGIIYVPSLPPYGILNVRYTALFLPGLCLFLPGSIEILSSVARRFSARFDARDPQPSFNSEEVRHRLGLVVLAGFLVFWGFRSMQGKETLAFYQEALVNGVERRQTDFQAAAFLKENYDGKPILMDLGYHGIVVQQGRIPLIRVVSEATDWKMTLAKPSLFVNWVIAQEGDGVWKFPVNWQDMHEHFELVFEAPGSFEKSLHIYRKEK